MAALARYMGAALLGILCSVPTVCAGQPELQEQEIQAGLMYNFLKYTQWPESVMAQGKIIVCLFEGDPFAKPLQSLFGRSVNERSIMLNMVRSMDETTVCQLLFIPVNAKNRWPELKKFLARKHILTVSNITGFVQNGGMIEFARKNNHISVNLNIDEVAAAELKVQEQLLKLVTIVHSEESSI